MNTTARIAIIEDNQDLREELVFFLQSKGYAVWGISTAEAFWKQLHRHPVDIVLVDINLPGEDGFSVVEHLRALGGYGVIVISARGSQQDKLHGLSLGADGYLIKPINFSSLVDNIATLWRRQCLDQAADSPNDSSPAVPAPSWTLSRTSLTSPTGIQVSLTPQEYELLDVLVRHKNEVCSKEQLSSLLFGYEMNPDTHRIDVIISRIRTKARKKGSQLPIRTIFGRGITFIVR